MGARDHNTRLPGSDPEGRRATNAAMDADEPLSDESSDGDEDEEALPVEEVVEAVARVALGDGSRRGHLAATAFDERGRPRVIEHSFVVENECHGWRLDRFLMKRIRRLS